MITKCSPNGIKIMLWKTEPHGSTVLVTSKHAQDEIYSHGMSHQEGHKRSNVIWTDFKSVILNEMKTLATYLHQCPKINPGCIFSSIQLFNGSP